MRYSRRNIQRTFDLLLWIGFILLLYMMFHDEPFFFEVVLCLFLGTQQVSTTMSTAVFLTPFVIGLVLLPDVDLGDETDDDDDDDCDEDDDPEPEDPSEPPRFGVALAYGGGQASYRSGARSGFTTSRSPISTGRIGGEQWTSERALTFALRPLAQLTNCSYSRHVSLCR
jgi:hypothetical protein